VQYLWLGVKWQDFGQLAICTVQGSLVRSRIDRYEKIVFFNFLPFSEKFSNDDALA
jgi:hypothetical protein